MAFVFEEAKDILNNVNGRAKEKVWIGLSTTTPTTSAGSGGNYNFTEPSITASYERVLIGESGVESSYIMSDPVNTSDASAMTKNNKLILFPEATASWGTVTHFGLFRGTDASNAKLVLFGALKNPIAVTTEVVPLFRVDQFSLSLKESSSI